MVEEASPDRDGKLGWGTLGRQVQGHASPALPDTYDICVPKVTDKASFPKSLVT